jgi:hypothetical protein
VHPAPGIVRSMLGVAGVTLFRAARGEVGSLSFPIYRTQRVGWVERSEPHHSSDELLWWGSPTMLRTVPVDPPYKDSQPRSVLDTMPVN